MEMATAAALGVACFVLGVVFTLAALVSIAHARRESAARRKDPSTTSVVHAAETVIAVVKTPEGKRHVAAASH